MERRPLRGVRVIAIILIAMGMYQLRFPLGFLFVIKINNPTCSYGYSAGIKKTNELERLLKEKSTDFSKKEMEILSGKLKDIRQDVELLKQNCHVVPNPMKLSMLICLISAALFVYTGFLILSLERKFWIFMILSFLISIGASFSSIWTAVLSVKPVYSLSYKFSVLLSEIYKTAKPSLVPLEEIAKNQFISPPLAKGIAIHLGLYLLFILAVCIYFNQPKVKEQFKKPQN